MNPLLRLSLLCAALHLATGADKKPRFVSPDGKYAVTLTSAEPQDEPGMTAVNLIEVKTGAVVKALDSVGHPWVDDTKAVWAPDSQRLALMTGSRRGGWTTLYAKAGATFAEVPMPELIWAKMKGRADAKTVLAARVPIRWTKANVLMLRNDVEDGGGNSGTSLMLLTFDQKNHVTVTRAKK